MTATCELEIKAHGPQAKIVFDLCHVMAKYGRELIDRILVDQANQLRKVIKRRACGYRSQQYFFLGIRAPLPGNSR